MTRTRAALVALTLALAGRAAGDPRVVRARSFDGVSWHDALEVVLASDGTLGDVRPVSVDVPPTRPGAVLTPGLIDLDAALGVRGRDAETPEALAGDLRLADAFDPDAAELEALRRSGVTTAWIGGGAAVVLSGTGALVQPAPAGRPARILRAAWGASASLSSAARDMERAPSSPPEQAAALRAALPGLPGPARVRFDDGVSARLAAALGLPVGLPGRLEDLTELRAARGLVASADWVSLRPDQMAPLLGWMHDAPLGLGSGPTGLGPAAVRVGAARLVEEGADPARVLRALTSDAADLLGDSTRGRLAVGSAADLVLWSGDPVSLASRPLVIWVAGEEIHHED